MTLLAYVVFVEQIALEIFQSVEDQRQIEAGTCAERTAEKEFQIIVW